MTEFPDEYQKELVELRSNLQDRILGAGPAVEEDLTAQKIVQRIKRTLLKAYDDDFLETPQAKIHEFVPKPIVEGDKVKITGGLVDGKKPFARMPDQARIKRWDGAWLHFTLTLRCSEKGKKLVEELWAYDFELVFPDGHSPAFVRFDLNEPGHENEGREIRSHMHPANDDLLVPAPVMSPEELLDVLIRRLWNNRDEEHPRS
jgi:hypothetical protein